MAIDRLGKAACAQSLESGEKVITEGHVKQVFKVCCYTARVTIVEKKHMFVYLSIMFSTGHGGI